MNQNTRSCITILMGLVIGMIPSPAVAQQAAARTLDRTVLPIHEPEPPLYTELEARKVKPSVRFEVYARKQGAV